MPVLSAASPQMLVKAYASPSSNLLNLSAHLAPTRITNVPSHAPASGAAADKVAAAGAPRVTPPLTGESLQQRFAQLADTLQLDVRSLTTTELKRVLSEAGNDFARFSADRGVAAGTWREPAQAQALFRAGITLELVQRNGECGGIGGDLVPLIVNADIWPSERALRIVDVKATPAVDITANGDPAALDAAATATAYTDAIHLYHRAHPERTHSQAGQPELPAVAEDEVILYRLSPLDVDGQESTPHYRLVSQEGEQALIDVPADGDCFFSCVSAALGMAGLDPGQREALAASNRLLRQSLAQHLWDNPDFHGIFGIGPGDATHGSIPYPSIPGDTHLIETSGSMTTGRGRDDVAGQRTRTLSVGSLSSEGSSFVPDLSDLEAFPPLPTSLPPVNSETSTEAQWHAVTLDEPPQPLLQQDSGNHGGYSPQRAGASNASAQVAGARVAPPPVRSSFLHGYRPQASDSSNTFGKALNDIVSAPRHPLDPGTLEAPPPSYESLFPRPEQSTLPPPPSLPQGNMPRSSDQRAVPRIVAVVRKPVASSPGTSHANGTRTNEQSHNPFLSSTDGSGNHTAAASGASSNPFLSMIDGSDAHTAAANGASSNPFLSMIDGSNAHTAAANGASRNPFLPLNDAPHTNGESEHATRLKAEEATSRAVHMYRSGLAAFVAAQGESLTPAMLADMHSQLAAQSAAAQLNDLAPDIDHRDTWIESLTGELQSIYEDFQSRTNHPSNVSAQARNENNSTARQRSDYTSNPGAATFQADRSTPATPLPIEQSYREAMATLESGFRALADLARADTEVRARLRSEHPDGSRTTGQVRMDAEKTRFQAQLMKRLQAHGKMLKKAHEEAFSGYEYTMDSALDRISSDRDALRRLHEQTSHDALQAMRARIASPGPADEAAFKRLADHMEKHWESLQQALPEAKRPAAIEGRTGSLGVAPRPAEPPVSPSLRLAQLLSPRPYVAPAAALFGNPVASVTPPVAGTDNVMKQDTSTSS